MIQRLTTKITRKKLDIFLKRYASNKKTLDIGCSKGPYKKYFPNSIGVDIEKRDGVDVVADAHALPFKDAEFDRRNEISSWNTAKTGMRHPFVMATFSRTDLTAQPLTY